VTWSIVARGPNGEFGIAIASRFFAVGMLCPHTRSGVGAVATQALVNPHYGPKGLDLLGNGFSPSSVMEKLLNEDEGRNHRQVHLIDSKGRIAVHTGSACIDWCGHLAGEGFSVAGNMLAGPEVVQASFKKYQEEKNLPFPERLISALHAGEAAGGDKRGKQAAALRIHTTEEYPSLEIRVQPFATCLPSRARPAGITDRAVIEETVRKFSR
jgi:uncharacterized Ntn-hydrolase superfamily protein